MYVPDFRAEFWVEILFLRNTFALLDVTEPNLQKNSFVGNTIYFTKMVEQQIPKNN